MAVWSPPSGEPAEEEAPAPPGLAFLPPDWQMPRKRLPVGPVLSAFRRLVLPRVRRHLRGPGWCQRQVGPPRLICYQGGRQPLALEATLERILPGRPLSREEILVEQSEEPCLSLLVMLDTSLSLSGPFRVPAAVAGAVLAREAGMGRLAFMAFHTEVEFIIRFGEKLRPWEAAYRVLELPVGGATDLEAALRRGLTALSGGWRHGTHSVLITDAERTAGGDPLPWAARYPRLHVVHIGRRNRELAKSLASAGKGRLRRVESLDKLPEVLLDLVTGLAREARA